MTTKKKAKSGAGRKSKAKPGAKRSRKKTPPQKGRSIPRGTPPRKKARPEKPVEDPQLSLVDHLAELRNRFISTLLVLVAASAAAFVYREPLLDFLAAPAEQLIFTAPAEAFFAYLKLSILGGLVLSLPWLLWQAFAFIAPAIERKDRPWLAGGMFVCLLLFYTGAGFALAILKPAMEFFLSFAGPRLNATIKIDEYFSFVMTLALAFGFVFEMPVLVWVLAKIGLVESHMLSARWREAVVGILLLSAFLTPADVFTMTALALPMSLLYVISIYVARWAEPK